LSAETDGSVPLYSGSCHCAGVRFRVRIAARQALACNCSICQMKGFLHVIVPPENFELLSGAELLSSYVFNTGVARHRFCRRCGVHPFYTPRSHPDHVDVNVNCLDGDARWGFSVRDFDGQDWEQSVHTIR
jgi:hypothetical protein